MTDENKTPPRDAIHAFKVALSAYRGFGPDPVAAGDGQRFASAVDRVVDEMLTLIEARDRQSAEAFNQLSRTMQWAYAAGLKEGPNAAMDVLAGFLAGPGMLPGPDADPDWYATAAWDEAGEWSTPPEANKTLADGGPMRLPPQLFGGHPYSEQAAR